MPARIRTDSYSSQSSTSSSRDYRSRRSDDSYYAPSSAPTSTYTETRYSETKPASRYAAPIREAPRPEASRDTYDDLPMGTTSYPRSSSETYNSSLDDVEGDLVDSDDEEEGFSSQNSDVDSLAEPLAQSLEHIPALPPYRASSPRLPIRASNPHDFARLFPSMNRLSIRHDEFTSDGNMNLRVDDNSSRGCATQLFHLRMYDLARREFSLRRYCRDSGREVASVKRKYLAPATPKVQEDAEDAPTRPTVLKRSMTSAMKIMTSAVGGKGKSDSRPPFKRSNSGGSIFSNQSSTSTASHKRPGTAHSTTSAPSIKSRSRASTTTQPLATNTLKLEFSNYARVELHRRGTSSKSNKRYEFEWWGHRYSWRRSIDPHTGTVSFHLLRESDKNEAKGAGKWQPGRKGPKQAEMVAGPVAHIVPETRSPTEVRADEVAGGWVPPCQFWISDRGVLDAMTDVGDVIMATGLMALVDDCIKERWQTRASRIRRISVPLTHKTVDFELPGPKAFVQGLLSRRSTSERVPQSPLRDGIAAC